jgi:hypothetical protein
MRSGLRCARCRRRYCDDTPEQRDRWGLVRYHSGVVVIDQCCCGGCLTAREASAADSRGRLFDYHRGWRRLRCRRAQERDHELKDLADLSPAEHERHMRTGQLPETDAHLECRFARGAVERRTFRTAIEIPSPLLARAGEPTARLDGLRRSWHHIRRA